jgi:membrane-associated protein
MEDVSLWSQVWEICRHLFDTPKLMEILRREELMVAAFVAITLVVFTETGLLIGFCLPGDSLLVTAGLVAYLGNWPLLPLLGILCAAAILGDSVGYSIGYQTGPKIFKREQSFFFKKDHLLKAQEFYDKHGGITIVVARFIPILRTFAPVVAGVGRMEYRRFLFYNVFGGIGWVCSMILIGYSLTRVIDPLFKPIFGQDFRVQDHVEKVIIIVVFLSISPGIYHWLKAKYGKTHEPAPEPVEAR